MLTNTIVSEVLGNPSCGKHGSCQHLNLTPAQKFSIGKRAAENEVTATIHYYVKAFPKIPLKETSVQRMKNNYLSHIKTFQGTDAAYVQELSGKKDKPLLLGEQLHQQVRDYISYLHFILKGTGLHYQYPCSNCF